MKPLVALFLFSPMVSAATLTLAETEIHSTSGIANPAPSRYSQGYPNPMPNGEYPEYLEEDPEGGELAPPTTTEQVSPTRSKVITRTTSRPSIKNPQPAGVDIAPVIVPIYPGNGHHGPPRR